MSSTAIPQRPRAGLSGREPSAGNEGTTVFQIERRLRIAVDRLDPRLVTETADEFEVFIPGRLSINKRLDRVRHALGFLRGPFERRNG